MTLSVFLCTWPPYAPVIPKVPFQRHGRKTHVGFRHKPYDEKACVGDYEVKESMKASAVALQAVGPMTLVQHVWTHDFTWR